MTMRKLLLLLSAIFIFIAVLTVVLFIIQKNNDQPQEAAVIQQIRALNRWETASYTIQQVIDNGTTGNVFQQFLFGDRILLIAQGNVIAGFDLANLSQKSVTVHNQTITI